MATIAEYSVTSDAFPLGSLFQEVKGASMELDRVVPIKNAVIPYMWVRNASPETIDAAAKVHPALKSMRLVDEVEGVGLYRIEWDPEVKGIITCIVETEVTLLRGTGTEGEWVFEIRADSSKGVSAFQQCCTAHDIRLTLGHLYALSEVDTRGRYHLTPEQEEALVLAFNEGYYNEPRETNLEEIATQLGITRPSLSARLKRGSRNLIGNTLVHQQEGSDSGSST